MILTPCIFLQSIQQPTNALKYIEFMTSIKMLHASARQRQQQEMSDQRNTIETC